MGILTVINGSEVDLDGKLYSVDFIRKAISAALEQETVPEPVYKAVERILDEHSAWIERPHKEVTEKVALAATIAAHTIISQCALEQEAEAVGNGRHRIQGIGSKDGGFEIIIVNGKRYTPDQIAAALASHVATREDVVVQKLKALRSSIDGTCTMGGAWEIHTINLVLATILKEHEG